MFGKKTPGESAPAKKPAAPPSVVKEEAASVPAAKPEPKVSIAAEPAASKSVEKAEKKTPKEEKTPPSLHDDVFAEQAPEPEHAPSEADNMTTLRLQRARNRIWLDLRDGIDLKALDRMKAEEARAEVK